jgi:hypothetical protein
LKSLSSTLKVFFTHSTLPYDYGSSSHTNIAGRTAFDTETGRELWHTRGSGLGHRTPMTYRARVGGRQYVVVAAGGHGKVDGIKLGLPGCVRAAVGKCPGAAQKKTKSFIG